METISGDKRKAEGGLDGMLAMTLPLTASVVPAAGGASSQAPDGAGPSQGAAQATAAVKLSPKERESTLDALVEQGWLTVEPSSAKIWLGPRTFLELSNYLLDVAAEDVRELWTTRV